MLLFANFALIFWGTRYTLTSLFLRIISYLTNNTKKSVKFFNHRTNQTYLTLHLNILASLFEWIRIGLIFNSIETKYFIILWIAIKTFFVCKFFTYLSPFVKVESIFTSSTSCYGCSFIVDISMKFKRIYLIIFCSFKCIKTIRNKIF